MMRANHQEDVCSMEYETISIVIPPKPGEEHLYDNARPVTMDIACRSMSSSLEQEADLASSKLPFTWKLYEMLDNVAENGQDHIVSWVNNGKAFRVHNLDAFTNEVIPTYFKQSKYKSFQRQLYFYDFKRVSSGSGIGSYYHPMFVRGQKTRVLSMTPKKNCRRKSGSTDEMEETSWHQKNSNEEGQKLQFTDSQQMPENCRRISTESTDGDVPSREHDVKYKDDSTVFARWHQTVKFQSGIQDERSDPRCVNRVSFADEWNNGQSEQQSRLDRQVNNQWQNFLNQPVKFEPQDGETCDVFGGMTFHFVAGVPRF
jgi:hypothetical protein